MASNILFLPFRRTHSITLSSAVKQYISTKYDQHPDMFARDLETIDKLRVDAVNSLEAHTSGIRKLTAYAAQLVWIGGKFPIDVSEPESFGLERAIPYELIVLVVSQNNLRFELANVLYNLASLYSQLAVSLNRSTSEGLKAACNYFCQAAGVISHIKTEIIPELRTIPPEDMDTMTLESLQQLLLAQAQGCFWSKAVKDGLKDGLIAKLAAKVSDFYDEAAEFGTKSDTISTEWIHHMTAKQHHFAGAAQYRASRECLEKQNYGEEVARLRDSLICVNEALKEARWINKVVLADLNGLKSRVTEDLKRAEKDNDVIYLIPVPPKSELKTLGRAGMATPRVPTEISDPASTLGDRGIFGQPLFANLLQSLNLPGSLQALEKPLGLPLTLTSHADEIRQQDGLHRLRRSMHEISKLKESDASLYQEGVELLRSEAAEDDRAKLKHGTDRWTRPSSQQAAEKLYARVTELDGYLKSAQSSDELVKGKLEECEAVLQILSGSPRDLEEYVPSSRRAAITPQVEKAAEDLRSALNEVSRLEIRRKRVIEALREKAKADDINPAILVETGRLEREFPMQNIEPVQFENLFEERLQFYDSDRATVSEEQTEQKEVASRLREANAAFAAARVGDTSTKKREQALQRLENGYIKYKEIVSNLNTGRKFYNDLASIVSRFRDDAKNFAYQRRVEAGQIESDLSNSLSNLSLSSSTTTSNLQSQKQRESSRPHYSAAAPAEEPLTAPTPTRAPVAPPPVAATPPASAVWSPEMGIKFGGQPAGNASGSASGSGAPRNLRYPDANANPPMGVQGGKWDGTRGLKFG
ncbi:pH-response regulator protein palA/rim20 [Lobaria immixta]|nr:pH-response regulator protein palA/rim20 [Lobaria immixta]